MCGPACVSYADVSFSRLSLQDPAESFVDFALLFAELEILFVEDGEARAVVTAILEPPETFDKDGRRLFFPNISDDAAHKKQPGEGTLGRLDQVGELPERAPLRAAQAFPARHALPVHFVYLLSMRMLVISCMVITTAQTREKGFLWPGALP